MTTLPRFLVATGSALAGTSGLAHEAGTLHVHADALLAPLVLAVAAVGLPAAILPRLRRAPDAGRQPGRRS